MTRKKVIQESQWIREIAYIMLRNQGPFTRKMLAEELALIHPDTDIRSLLNEVSSALLFDKSCNQRFKTVRQSWYDLDDKYRENPG
jgi:hypothetical protein